jgi:hypothetical protein
MFHVKHLFELAGAHCIPGEAPSHRSDVAWHEGKGFDGTWQ